MRKLELQVGEYYARLSGRRMYAQRVCIAAPYVKHQYARDPHDAGTYTPRSYNGDFKTGALVGVETNGFYGKPTGLYWQPQIVPLGQLVCTWDEWLKREAQSKVEAEERAVTEKAALEIREKEWNEIIIPVLKAAKVGGQTFSRFDSGTRLSHSELLRLCQYARREALEDAAAEVIDRHDRNVDINENGNATGAWIPTAEVNDLKRALGMKVEE